MHPLVAVVLRPVARVAVALLGRRLRTWWQKLPQQQQHTIRQHFHTNRFKYAGVTMATCGGSSAVYFQNCVYCPFSDQTRFMLFQQDHMKDLDDILFQEELENAGPRLLDSESVEVQTVMRVGNRLVKAHKSLATKMWQVAVINSPEVNCYCLSSGRIVIYTGMMEACQNEDQLAAVLSHEMAHVLLQHQNVKLSHECLVDVMMLPVTFLSWCLSSSDLLSLLLTGLVKESSSVAFLLPYSRHLETEADLLGLSLLTLACYDSREASALWQRFESAEQLRRVYGGDGQEGPVAEWFSTHPSHKHRYELMDHCIPGALKWREKLQCPRLPSVDPRDAEQQPPPTTTAAPPPTTTAAPPPTTTAAPPSSDDYYGLRRALRSCPLCQKRVSGADSCACYSTSHTAEYITLPPGVTYDGHPDSCQHCCNDALTRTKAIGSVISTTADSIVANRRILAS